MVVSSTRVYPEGAGGCAQGCAQVRRPSGLAFHGRKRASAGPARGVPVAAAFIKVSAQVWAKPIRSGWKFGEDSHSQPVDREWSGTYRPRLTPVFASLAGTLQRHGLAPRVFEGMGEFVQVARATAARGLAG
jgi:hypothetical protein